MTLFRLGALLRSIQHLHKINLQRGGDAEQRFQRRVTQAPLDKTHHLLGKTGGFCDSIHGKAPTFPFRSQDLGDSGANGLLRFVGYHA